MKLGASWSRRWTYSLVLICLNATEVYSGCTVTTQHISHIVQGFSLFFSSSHPNVCFDPDQLGRLTGAEEVVSEQRPGQQGEYGPPTIRHLHHLHHYSHYSHHDHHCYHHPVASLWLCSEFFWTFFLCLLSVDAVLQSYPLPAAIQRDSPVRLWDQRLQTALCIHSKSCN